MWLQVQSDPIITQSLFDNIQSALYENILSLRKLSPPPASPAVWGGMGVRAKSLQSCPALCNPMDCSPPGSSVHGISQARLLQWVAMPSSRESSPSRDQTCVSCGSCIAGGFFTAGPPGKPMWSGGGLNVSNQAAIGLSGRGSHHKYCLLLQGKPGFLKGGLQPRWRRTGGQACAHWWPCLIWLHLGLWYLQNHSLCLVLHLAPCLVRYPSRLLVHWVLIQSPGLLEFRTARGSTFSSHTLSSSLRVHMPVAAWYCMQ